jgi:molecular chaperone DnaK
LKKVELPGLTPKPKGKVKINVTFFMDVNGILTVTGKEVEKGKNNSVEITIKNDMVNFTEEEIEKLKKKK